MSIKKNSKNSRNRKIGTVLLILAGVLLAVYFFMPRRKYPRVPYSVFIQQVEKGQVVGVQIDNKKIVYRLKGEEDQNLVEP